MSSQDEVLYSVDRGVGHVVLNRPQARNALTFEMYDRLAQICRSVPADGSLRVLVVSGAGGKAFAAGTDISLFRDFGGAESGIEYERRMSERIGHIEACPVPMIAAISGACTGGGAAIAGCCDIRLATADMRFGFPIARTLGNCLSSGSLAKMVSLVGPARIAEMILTARLIDAAEAKSIGLVSEIHPDHDAVVARALALAAEMAELAPITLRVTKEMLRRLRTAGPKADDADLIAMAYGSRDFREGLESFLAKRKPKWTGT
ncbi:MAG: enoyl-CoA hydratase/isomerase family protein [Hyphomicrobiales bacterium]|nr:enoyl-CoA hydratase/isomerase family protein [Hyphomicrobiales bacterium]